MREQGRPIRSTVFKVFPPLFLGCALLATTAVQAARAVDENAAAVVFLGATIAGAAVVAWSAYREADSTGVFMAAVHSAARGVFFTCILTLGSVAYNLFLGDLLGLTKTLEEMSAEGDLGVWDAVWFWIVIAAFFGLLIGTPVGLLGWVFGPLKPSLRRRAPPA